MAVRETLLCQWEAAVGFDRVVLATEMVRERLRRSIAALRDGDVPYAVVGGFAVAYWVARLDPSATRTTPEVNVIVRRADVDRATCALVAVGFVPGEMPGGVLFIDGPDGKERSALRVYFAGEKVRADDAMPMPDVSESIDGEHFRVIELVSLLRMKLTAFRNKDKMHLHDLMGVGAIGASWKAVLIPELAARFQEILDNPEGDPHVPFPQYPPPPPPPSPPRP